MIEAEKEIAQLAPIEKEAIARSTENIPPIFPT
jgi:hypothetical protein